MTEHKIHLPESPEKSLKRGRPRKTNRMGGETMEAIAEAAATVLVREGGGRFTLEKVAKEAGITKGTLLYHFHDKEQLLLLLMNRYVDRLTTRLEEGVASAREKGICGSDETASGFAEWYRRFRKEKAGYTNFGLLILTLSATDEQLRARMNDWYRLIFERIRESPAGDNAIIAVLAIEGLFYLRHFQLNVLDTETEDRILNTLAALCSRGSHELEERTSG